MRILVTGGAGYIGSVTAAMLAAAELGWKPRRPALRDMVADAWSFASARARRAA